MDADTRVLNGSNPFYKTFLAVILASMVSGLMALASAWFTFGASKPTKDEVQSIIQHALADRQKEFLANVKEIIETNSPYMRDRSLIQQSLTVTTANLDKLIERVDRLTTQQGEMYGRMGHLLSRLEK